MYFQRRFFIYLLLFSIITLYSCSNIKYLPTNEQLYVGSVVSIHSEASIKNKKNLKKELKNSIRPKPNKAVFGIRTKLWIYNVTNKSQKNGIKKWLNNKFGEKPTLLSDQRPKEVSEVMANQLQNLGYFKANVVYKVISKNKKAKIEYTATIEEPYRIKKIIFPIEDDALSKEIKATEEKSRIKEGVQYNLDLLKEERVRIDNRLKQNGYYFFNPNYLLFKADSSTNGHELILTVTVKTDVPEKAKYAYTLNNIYIFPSYRLNKDSVSTKLDTIKIDNYYYINTDSSFHPKTIIRSVFLKKGNKYSKKAHNLTISRLMGIGIFKFVNIKFVDTIINDNATLDAFIYLTQTEKKSLQLQIEAVTKSNNYTGPAVTLSYKDRNAFKGAELFVANIIGNFETQLTKRQKGLYSFEVGANTQLYIPKFVTPFNVKNPSSLFVPKTKFDISFKLMHRALFFNMNSFNISYGYTWKESAQKEYEITPIAINFAKLMKTTPAFEALLNENRYLRKSFEQQFTIGSIYSFTYNTLIGKPKKNQYYFNATLDLSGNTIYFLQSALKSKKTVNNEYSIGGYMYSQYSKLTTDTRYYLSLNKKSKLATRLIIGAGIPYMNSTTLPYVKQFFSGGANSIRGFLPRTVGPGMYETIVNDNSKLLIDKAGDIKLEANIEYRFDIVSVLKGALFTDAGNIWLVNKNDELPGGEFKINTFQQQIAVSAGFGLRIDISFFVIRFDLAAPLRKPYLPENEQWVINKINFGSSGWRKDNLVLNIAIGYPF